MMVFKNETFGLLKTILDAHTMGIRAAANLLEECGYRVILAPQNIENALSTITSENSQRLIVKWIMKNNINHIGFSYRLDTDNAINYLGRFVTLLKREGLYESSSAVIKTIYFAGLIPACKKIEKEYEGRIKTLCGGEMTEETLSIMGIPQENIPKSICEGCKYDKEILAFGRKLIKEQKYKNSSPLVRNSYAAYGSSKDTLLARLNHNFKDGFQPLIRAHSGPYSSEMTREECLREYNFWCRNLAKSGYLDILSIGSSQLSQSNFGEDWAGKENGGGVPVNSETEYIDIRNAAKPMLVRTYSATKNIKRMANIYEKTINISWHALSLWWFNELDGRGPNSLYDNLKEHIDTIKYIATTNKPVEANVSHHFSFRGFDDITYIVSAYISAKMIKKCGVRTFILQNMLNTPRSTWGIQDLAKARAMLNMIKKLEDENFRVIFQTRTGLDYFKPDIEVAKAQLAAATAMMDDIDPDNIYSPEIVHVVSYSEALYLATPDIINDSIKITRHALKEYRKLKKKGLTPNVKNEDINERTRKLEASSWKVIKAMEENIVDLYSPEGFYIAFVAGWLPVPELWSDSNEFIHAKNWKSKMISGGVVLVDHDLVMAIDTRINKCISYIPNAKYILKNKYSASV